MQNNAISSGGYGNHSAGSTKSREQYHKGDAFASRYSSYTWSPETTLSLTPYTDTTVQDSLYYSRLLMQQHQQQQQQKQQQQQDMINRHNLCLTRLREAAKEAEMLRDEVTALRSVNLELNKHISLLIKSSVNELASNDFNNNNNNNNNAAMTSFDVLDGMRGLSIGGGDREEACVESPTSVMENVDVKRVTLPKSISVRSNGYLKTGQAPPNKTRPRTPTPLNNSTTQKVYVRGGKKEEEPLELEVYNQGMFKTELCNKWQETGACPYGDHCQFAHGIDELRPVIRHPRYKTEVCRMVLAGDICPYGHRCHFRHALTDQERYMSHRHLNPRSLKLN